jgi:hypothetical protein
MIHFEATVLLSHGVLFRLMLAAYFWTKVSSDQCAPLRSSTAGIVFKSTSKSVLSD